MSVAYSGGKWSGRLATHLIAIHDEMNLVQPVQAYLALIESSTNFFIKNAEWEGIMGLAYSSLAKVLIIVYNEVLIDYAIIMSVFYNVCIR